VFSYTTSVVRDLTAVPYWVVPVIYYDYYIIYVVSKCKRSGALLLLLPPPLKSLGKIWTPRSPYFNYHATARCKIDRKRFKQLLRLNSWIYIIAILTKPYRFLYKIGIPDRYLRLLLKRPSGYPTGCVLTTVDTKNIHLSNAIEHNIMNCIILYYTYYLEYGSGDSVISTWWYEPINAPVNFCNKHCNIV